MTITLPPIFLERLRKIVPADQVEAVLKTFSIEKSAAYRVNTLKADVKEIFSQLKLQGIEIRLIDWCDFVFLVAEDLTENQKEFLGQLVNQGSIYKQNLSSIYIPLVLNPKPGERVLDLCAAPGSKTTQMAMMMNNTGKMVCVDPIKDRFYKLKAVIDLLGVKNTECVCCDGRKFRQRRGEDGFDKILVDAPCSSEGRFNLNYQKSLDYWSPRKIKEMVQKQRGLLLNASRLLKPKGTLVYSTCTFAPEENEGIVSWVLKKSDVIRLAPIELKPMEIYPVLTGWEKKIFSPNIFQCLRILPTSTMDGFFVAKFIRI